jgi:hypothetical protein
MRKWFGLALVSCLLVLMGVITQAGAIDSLPQNRPITQIQQGNRARV